MRQNRCVVLFKLIHQSFCVGNLKVTLTVYRACAQKTVGTLCGGSSNSTTGREVRGTRLTGRGPGPPGNRGRGLPVTTHRIYWKM